jgi:hypothetical protein
MVPRGLGGSGSHCVPGSDKAPAAIPKNGWCPAGARAAVIAFAEGSAAIRAASSVCSVRQARCAPRRKLGVLPLPAGERVGVRGFGSIERPQLLKNHRETLTPHPTPLPMGEGADRVRGPTVVMAGLVPAIHVFDAQRKDRRGCPAQGRA